MDPLAPPPSWKTLKPEFGALLKVLGSLTSREELLNMSSADDANESDKHLSVIEAIARTGVVPSPLTWHPSEALMQYRVRVPQERAAQEQNVAHAGRAFACAILLRAACDESNSEFVMAEIEDVQWLCQSVLALGPEVQELGARFLAQCAYEPDCLDELHAYVALGALVLSMNRPGHEANVIKSCTQYVYTLCDLYRRPRHRHWGETGEPVEQQLKRYGAFMDLARTQLDMCTIEMAAEQIALLRKRLFGTK